HFYSLPIYGLIGNLILLPIFSVVIMPLVCIGVITIMFGWMLPIDAATKTYELLLSVATKIVTLPGATITLPHISNAALVCIILGLMCVMFIRPLRIKINYILGAVFICIGV